MSENAVIWHGLGSSRKWLASMEICVEKFEGEMVRAQPNKWAVHDWFIMNCVDETIRSPVGRRRHTIYSLLLHKYQVVAFFFCENKIIGFSINYVGQLFAAWPSMIHNEWRQLDHIGRRVFWTNLYAQRHPIANVYLFLLSFIRGHKIKRSWRSSPSTSCHSFLYTNQTSATMRNTRAIGIYCRTTRIRLACFACFA